jgi:hypothetical protein
MAMIKMFRRLVLPGLTILVLMAGIQSTLVLGADKSAAGTIKGKVNYCSRGGYIGMQVFIPGRQFNVFLGKDGHFIFKNVPAGKYDINYVINGRLVNENKDVPVTAGGTNDLGEIAFCGEDTAPSTSTPSTSPENAKTACEENPQSPECVDNDKDGVVAAKDCDDTNPDIRPGAIERCDGVDNNCNGEVDEVLSVDIQNGVGFCSKGHVSVKSCNKGFDDCDKDPTNGCETDIMNDNDNCGRCGNQCSDIEICRLGFC